MENCCPGTVAVPGLVVKVFVSFGEGVRGGELPLWIGLPGNAELEFMHVVVSERRPRT